MCGRYVLAQTEGIPDRFELQLPLSEFSEFVRPRFNVAPTQTMPVIIRESPKRLELMRWGLIPSWAKDPSIGNRMINARAETVAEKPAFRRSLRYRRCLIPATGFYEWQKGPQKTPYHFALKTGKLFAFAGLWDTWLDPTGSEIRSYTIITTQANALLAPVHDRMPAILRREDEDLWGDPEETDASRVIPLLTPYPAEEMAAYPVSPAVNNPRNDSPVLVQPSQG